MIHLTAQAGVRYSIENPHVYADANLVGHLNILVGCHQTKVKHLVYAYSSSVYAVTSHLEQRIWQHKNAIIDGFTHKYKVDQLVYFESHQSMYEAITREKQLKKWCREWNIELINSQNPTWQDLWYTVISGSPRPRG